MLNKDRILALDIGASSLKMAEFVALKSGGLELINFSCESLGVDSQSDVDRGAFIVQAVRRMMRETGIKPGPALVSVAGQSVFSRYVKLPPVDSERIYQIILYEAQQNVPFPIDEVVWDYQLIGGATGEVDVLLAAIKAEMIEKMTDSVGEAGLDPDLVDVAPMALYNTVRYNYDDLAGCTLVVDIGARSTDLIFIEEGRIFTRSLPVAGNTITQHIMREFNMNYADAEDLKRAHAFVAFGGAYEGPASEVADKVSKSVRSIMTRMHAEINRSINFYRSQQGGGKPELILLTGGTSVIPYTDTFLKEKLKVEVDYLNPFRNVAVGASISAEEIGKSAHLMGELVGLGLRKVLSCPIELNLMPKKVLKEKELRKKRPYFIGAGVAAVLAMMAVTGYIARVKSYAASQLADISARVDDLSAIESQLSAEEQRIGDISGKMDEIYGLMNQRSLWIRMMSQIHSALPSGMWIASIVPVVDSGPAAPAGQPKAPGVVTALAVKGRGYLDVVRSATPILEFRDNLRKLDFVSEETEIQRQPAPGADDFAREFEIKIVLQEGLPL
ncbi:MAG TPA: type IV pilus assembly protein PilM [Kiritimatiellia bacterium]|nr:type IV pilus assembly protein PilM [Kiritimatiellia bacterium]